MVSKVTVVDVDVDIVLVSGGGGGGSGLFVELDPTSVEADSRSELLGSLEVATMGFKESRDLTVAPAGVIEGPNLFGIALVPPVGSESSKEVDKSGGIRDAGTRTGSND